MDASTKEVDKRLESIRTRSQASSDIEAPVDISPEKREEPPSQDKTNEYPPTAQAIIITICLCLATFLVALDRTIVATAIPRITDEFHSIQDIGWYGSVYLLMFCAFQLFFGRIFTFYSVKWVYLSLIVFFEIGSIVCAAAPSSNAFIVGRALTGLGASGMFSGGIIILVATVPLEKRPIYQSGFSMTFGVASVAGPLLGGAFTTDLTWRWCFWINLPLGGVVLVLLAFLLKAPKPMKAGTPWQEQIDQLDPYGTAVFLPAIVCLLLALQWGGTTYSWSSPTIVVLLVLGSVLFLAFIAIQFWRKDRGTIPPRILKQRSCLAGFFYIFFTASVMMTLIYYIPIYFQAIKGASAIESGLMTLPFLLSLVISGILSGVVISKTGYYVPFMYLGTVFQAVGAGLICTWDVHTAHPEWIGYQVIYGFGLGVAMMQPATAAQAVLEKKDVSTGVSIMFFAQSLGGAIFIAVGQTLLTNGLATNLANVPGVSATKLVATGATDLRQLATAQNIDLILEGYNLALRNVFYMGAALASVTIIPCIFMEWINIKGKKVH